MYACLDIGGTAIKAGVLSKEGNIIESTTLEVFQEWEELIEVVCNWINLARNKYEIKGVCISSPGAVDSFTGIVGGSSAIPCIHGPNWKEVIFKNTGLKASIENDANCAALAEVFSGEAKGLEDILFVVCGTGIGGAIIKDGKIHKGKNLHGGEFGYMLMEENNGEYKNFSEVASTMSFVRKVRAHYKDESYDGIKVFEEAKRGDKVCIESIDTFYKNLAKGIFNIQYVYDPELILIGGAISDREDFIDSLNEKIDELMKKVEIAKVRPIVKTCTHKKNANLIGALANYISEYGE